MKKYLFIIIFFTFFTSTAKAEINEKEIENSFQEAAKIVEENASEEKIQQALDTVEKYYNKLIEYIKEAIKELEK